MDDRDLHNFFGPAKRHRLTVREKERSFNWLDDRIARGHGQHAGSFLWRTLRFACSSWTPVAAVIIISVTTGAGLSFAQNSLPGDPLYPLKRFGEQIRSRVSLDAESKAEVEVDHMDARLEEAAMLESKGKLTEEAAVQLDADFQSQHSDAKVHIQALEERPPRKNAVEKIEKIRERLQKTEERYERTLKPHRRQALPAVINAGTDVKMDVRIDAKMDSKIDARMDATAGIFSTSGSEIQKKHDEGERMLPKKIEKLKNVPVWSP